jgi:hypothetical protein
MLGPLQIFVLIAILLKLFFFVKLSALYFEKPDLARIALLAKFVDAVSLFHSHLYCKAFVIFSSVPIELDRVAD